MRELPMPVVIWLLALSFWTGTVYVQVQQNSKMIMQEKMTTMRIWEKLDIINERLSIIQGKLSEK